MVHIYRQNKVTQSRRNRPVAFVGGGALFALMTLGIVLGFPWMVDVVLGIAGGATGGFFGLRPAKISHFMSDQVFVPTERVFQEYAEKKYRFDAYLDVENGGLFVQVLNHPANRDHYKELAQNEAFLGLFGYRFGNSSDRVDGAVILADVRKQAKRADKEKLVGDTIRDILVRPYDLKFIEVQVKEIEKKLNTLAVGLKRLGDEVEASDKLARKELGIAYDEESARKIFRDELNNTVASTFEELKLEMLARYSVNYELEEKAHAPEADDRIQKMSQRLHS